MIWVCLGLGWFGFAMDWVGSNWPWICFAWVCLELVGFGLALDWLGLGLPWIRLAWVYLRTWVCLWLGLSMIGLSWGLGLPWVRFALGWVALG